MTKNNCYSGDSYCKELNSLLREVIVKENASGLLLSGGLDSSIIASFQKPAYTFTVNLEGYGSDQEYAKIIAEKYSTNHIKIEVKNKDLLDIEEKIIKLFKTFDPMFLRNSSVIFAAIQKARQVGVSTVTTGDGGDELFAGYNYLKKYFGDLPRLEQEVKRLWKIMHFPSKKIGNYFNVTVFSPYLDEKIIQFAKSLDISLNIGEYKNKLWGKFLLRKCFQKWENLENHSWREKQAQEEGSGFSNIGKYIYENLYSDSEFLNEIKRIKKTEDVNIRNKEHLFYYLTYRRYFPIPASENKLYRLKSCPDCNCSFEWSGSFCRVCGAYPVTPSYL